MSAWLAGLFLKQSPYKSDSGILVILEKDFTCFQNFFMDNDKPVSSNIRPHFLVHNFLKFVLVLCCIFCARLFSPFLTTLYHNLTHDMAAKTDISRIFWNEFIDKNLLQNGLHIIGHLITGKLPKYDYI